MPGIEVSTSTRKLVVRDQPPISASSATAAARLVSPNCRISSRSRGVQARVGIEAPGTQRFTRVR